MGHPRRHHLKEAVARAVVQRHIEHQRMLGVERRSLLGAAGGGMPQRHSATRGYVPLEPRPKNVRASTPEPSQAPGLRAGLQQLCDLHKCSQLATVNEWLKSVRQSSSPSGLTIFVI